MHPSNNKRRDRTRIIVIVVVAILCVCVCVVFVCFTVSYFRIIIHKDMMMNYPQSASHKNSNNNKGLDTQRARSSYTNIQKAASSHIYINI